MIYVVQYISQAHPDLFAAHFAQAVLFFLSI